jgi:hypothetical protein
MRKKTNPRPLGRGFAVMSVMCGLWLFDEQMYENSPDEES